MISKSNGQEVVLKKSTKKMSEMTDKERDRAISEAIHTVRLGKVGSAFLIKGYEAFKSPDEHVCIVLEYAQKGSIKPIIATIGGKQKKKRLPSFMNYFFQMILAIKFLHDK